MDERPSPPAIRHIRAISVGLLTAVSSWASASQNSAPGNSNENSTLLLGILVEGLDADYLNLLSQSFGPDGFNRIVSQASFALALDYGLNADATSATAMLVTGAGARLNGIPSERVFDLKLLNPVDVLSDPASLGNFTSETLSPAPIRVSTIADELRVATAGLGKVYSVSADPEQSILLAGHAGNSAIWIDDTSGKLATSTYYKEVPPVLSKVNYGNPLTTRMDTMRWTASRVPAPEGFLPPNKQKYPFSYTYPSKVTTSIDAFKRSPLANTEITDVAIAQIGDTKGDSKEMVAVCYNLSPYPYSHTADNRHELVDAYRKLDRDIARLIKAAESRTPGRKPLVLLAGIPHVSAMRRDEDQWRIPGGVFSPKKAVSLLNMYLMALHGHGEWVSGYHNRQFYLNPETAKARNVALADLRAESSEFLAKMSGVARAYTVEQAMAADSSDAILPTAAGDVFVDILPGWEIESVRTSSSSGNTYHQGVERATSALPLYLLVPGRNPVILTGKVDARRVAPTVARILRIRSPGGASEPPLPF